MKQLKISMFVFVMAFLPMMSFALPLPLDTNPMVLIEGGITWATDMMDVGEIPQGTPKEVIFEFTNDTEAPILVKKVKASCGCTATDYTKEAIAPGEKGYVKAKYNAKKLGAFTKSVTVTTSDSETPKRLTLKGKVVAASN